MNFLQFYFNLFKNRYMFAHFMPVHQFPKMGLNNHPRFGNFCGTAQQCFIFEFGKSIHIDQCDILQMLLPSFQHCRGWKDR